jgi:uncharacterized protein YukE
MTTIRADYSVMTAGSEGLTATWGRIEQHLADLTAAVGGTADMSAGALAAYRALAARWAASAQDRQVVLRSLSEALARARDHYRQVDAALAAHFRV